MKLYLDTSFINRCVDLGHKPREVRCTLLAMGYEPTFGIQGIYELARTFLVSEGEKRGIALFTFLRDLDPSYGLTVHQLFDSELLKLRTGALVIPVQDPMNYASTKIEINRLANGTFDGRARAFISKRQREIEKDHPKTYVNYIEHVKRAKEKDPTIVNTIQNYDDAMAYFSDQIPKLVSLIMRGSIAPLEALRLANNLDHYPAIRSATRANLYLCYISIKHEQVPGKNRVDDFRQVVEASYCDAMIMCDDILSRTIEYINPQMEVVSFDKFRLKILQTT